MSRYIPYPKYWVYFWFVMFCLYFINYLPWVLYTEVENPQYKDPIILATINLLVDPVFALLFHTFLYGKFQDAIFQKGGKEKVKIHVIAQYLLLAAILALIDSFIFKFIADSLNEDWWFSLSIDQSKKVNLLRNFPEAFLSITLFTGIWSLYQSNLELFRNKYNLEVEVERLSRRGILHDYDNVFSYLGVFQETKSIEDYEAFFNNLMAYSRYLIYDRVKAKVPLNVEAKHLINYFALRSMKINRSVKLISECKLEEMGSSLKIVPGLLVEGIRNALKHCKTDSDDSFVRMKIELNGRCLYFLVENRIKTKETRNNIKNKEGGLEYTKKCLKTYYLNKSNFKHKIKNNVYSYLIQIEL